MKYLIPFHDDRAVNPNLVGQKFASLARAQRSGFAVPPAAAISTEAHRHFSLHQSWPDDLHTEVQRIADELDLSRGVSIRSSAVREDLEDQSFAGQYQSFLNIFSQENLRSKIVRCWQSANAGIVQCYERSGAKEPGKKQSPLMGVIVQRMVKAAAAGVAFGCHPVNPASGEIVIEAVYGLAEPLVSGRLSPHRAFVDPIGRIRVEPPDAEAGASRDPLSTDQWRQIAALLRKLENTFGQGHLDIEWAIDETGMLWLLQSRRITTTAEAYAGVPSGTWTRKIANDLWADRLTPFLGRAMTDSQARFTLTRTCRILGIPVIRPTLAVINGYLYVNCESIGQVVSLLPRRFRTSDLKALFPDGVDVDDLPVARIRSQVAVALRAVLLILMEPEANPMVCRAFQSSHRKKIRQLLANVRSMPDRTPVQALRKTLGALEAMAVIQEKNQWPYSHATVFTWLLRWVSVDLTGLSHSEFLGLLSERGRNVTICIERQFRRMAESLRQDRKLAKRVITEAPEMLLGQLPTEFQQMLNHFINRYGCRSRHRTLVVKRWAEAPEEVVAILQALIRRYSEGRTDDRSTYPSDPQKGKAPVVSNHAPAGDDTPEKAPVRAGIGSILLRRMLPIVVRLTSRFLDLREELRFLLDEVLFEIRRSLLTLGKLTGMDERVMFLYAEELQALVAGELSLEKAGEVSTERYRRYHQPVEVHASYIDGRPVEEFPTTARVLRGIGTSPGRVTGRAKIVRDPAVSNLSGGEILIAQNTDPGWTPILSMVGGIVVEEGGLLNHCSIVARELKVPAIVGIRQATRIIPDGTLISIDGGLGLVRIQEE